MSPINIKKYAMSVLFIAMFTMLSACSENSGSTAPTPPSQGDTNETSSIEPTVTNDGSADGASSGTSNILIVYFAVAENSEVDAISSASVRVVNGEARGHIRVLADVIQRNVGGDMFSILTSVKYPADVNGLINYASDEQKENGRPELTSHIDNLDDYDVFFIGYPNWWYDLPMAMYSFFEAYDFSGKTIVPFCTHNGSRFSSTMNTIRELEPDATVLDGFTTNGDKVEDVDSDVIEWIAGLGI